MFEILDRYRTEALAELHELEAERKRLKGLQGEVGAKIYRVGTRLQLIAELRADVALDQPQEEKR